MAGVSTGTETKVVYEFFFVYRENGILKEFKEESACWTWAQAYDYFIGKCRQLGITGENIQSCSWREKGEQGASAFGGAADFG